MKPWTSFQELETLGEGLVRDYLKRFQRRKSICLDIEGLARDYLRLEIAYADFAETDRSRIGFLSGQSIRRARW